MIPNTSHQATSNPTENFLKLHEVLKKEFRQVTYIWNATADKPLWQARFFFTMGAGAPGTFIDLLDGRLKTKPSIVVIHNKAWCDAVPEATVKFILSVINKTDADYRLHKGVHFGD